jgi:hypothetical protein
MPSRPICLFAFLFKTWMCTEQLYSVQTPSSIPYHCYINTTSLIALSQTQLNALCVLRPIMKGKRYTAASGDSTNIAPIRRNKLELDVLASESSATHE